VGGRSHGNAVARKRGQRVHYFADTAKFALRLARAARLGASALVEHRFPDGESLVQVPGVVGSRAILVRSLNHPNSKLLELLLAADALRRSGAEQVVLVAPYLPYMRQDTVFAPGQPVSQKVIGRILAEAFDGIFTVEAHLHRIQRLSQIAGRGARSLSAAPAIQSWMRRHAPGAMVVGPDAESAPWTRAIAGDGAFPQIVGNKSRAGDLQVEIEFPRDIPHTERAVIVDDIASSGVTLAAAARALHRRGIATVDALVVHAIFAPGAEERIRRASIGRVFSSDTVPHPTNEFSVAGLVAETLVGEARDGHHEGTDHIAGRRRG